MTERRIEKRYGRGNKTWWQYLLSGFDDRAPEEMGIQTVYPPRTPLKPELGLDPLVGEPFSPLFLYELEELGYSFNHDYVWWQRVWTTGTPKYANRRDDRVYPNMKQIWETYLIDAPSEKWTYRIVNPENLGGAGGGGGGGNCVIWEDELGKRK